MTDDEDPSRRTDWRELVKPMRLIDYVEEPEPPSRWIYRARGWRGRILPTVFMVLILVSAAVHAGDAVSWLTWRVSGTVILGVMASVNVLLILLERRRDHER